MSSTNRHCLPLPVQFAPMRDRSTIGLTNGSRAPLRAGLGFAAAILWADNGWAASRLLPCRRAEDCARGLAGWPASFIFAFRGAAAFAFFPLSAGAGAFGKGNT